jgi:AAA domain-containing protein/TIR domain-containing protein
LAVFPSSSEQTAGTAAAPPAGRRVFISYSHSEPDEVELANHLTTGLQRAGFDVFIDTGMLVGTDWVTEIERRIYWCDYLVVLLSRTAIASEMVQGEIRLAAKSRDERRGLPHLLPVRVRYVGPLDYELDSRLARIQYSRWESVDDSPRVLAELIAASRGTHLPEEPACSARPADTKPPRPLPRIDPRSLTVEGGALPSDEALYVTRNSDDVVVTLARRTGQTLVIKAAKQMGKSSLLVRYLSECMRQEPPKRLAFIDLSVLSRDDLGDYSTFLTQLAGTVLRSLDLPADAPPAIPNQLRMTWFVEDQVLRPTGGRVVFAFDAVDRLLGRPYQSDFFTMLRSWHNNRANLGAKWRHVDLALVISTEPYLLIDDDHRSIFNVGRTVLLDPFSLDDYRSLNEACGTNLPADRLEALWKLLGGHPYLTRLAFYWLVSDDRLTYDDLLVRAADERGPFGEHLRAMLLRLHQRPALLARLRLLETEGANLDDEVYYRLLAIGIVKKERGRAVIANDLYRQFFTTVLA